MSPRTISPPPEDWDDLPTALTPGERQVGEFFDRHLPDGWEIYAQPHLNGLQPDFVLLHPDIGVAVYEVKDWNPASSSYWVRYCQDEPVLMARYPGTRVPVALRDQRNPFLRVRDYKDYVHGICTAAITGDPSRKYAGYGRITAGVIFTLGGSGHWNQLARHFVRHDEPPKYYPVVGHDALSSDRIDLVLPEVSKPRHGLMNETVANYLRPWLREPDFVRQQRQPISFLTNTQRRLVNEKPGNTGMRRLSGPAGSGKSVVLAARAAQLAHEAKQVLVVGFNITLSHYLRDMAVRYLRRLSSNRYEYRNAYRRMVFTHFHEWKRWGKHYDNGTEFDAILVDEGQDFEPQWWHEMHTALKCGGEMMLAFDQTQDIYRRAGAWTEDKMQGAGFRGRWNRLEISHRLPPVLTPILRSYADRFMGSDEVDLPHEYQMELHPLTLRWVQMPENGDWISVCIEELDRLQRALPQDSGVSDIVCMIPEHLEGYHFVGSVEKKFNIHVSHVFSDSEDAIDRQRNSRPLKRAFWAGSGQVKAVTIHSFKGWEARHLLIYIDDIQKNDAMPALFYTALTRLKSHENGTSLTVVSSCPRLRAFGKEYFEDFTENSTDTNDDLAYPRPRR